MNKRKIKMFRTIYENILILREDLIQFLSENLPVIYAENWWEKSVVNTFLVNSVNNNTVKDKFRKAKYLNDNSIYTFSSFDFSELLYILIYNWQEVISFQNISNDRSISLFYKIKTIRDNISHADDDKMSSDNFKNYIAYLNAFSGVIHSRLYDSNKMMKYIGYTVKNIKETAEIDKKERIIKLIEKEVIEPALQNDKLSDDVKDSITRTLIKFEISETIDTVHAFFSGALLSPRGEYIYNELHRQKLKAFEVIRKEYNEIYYS